MATPINKILTNQQQEFSQEELANVSASLSAILGQGGGGGGEPCASAWLPSVDENGNLSWTLTMSTTTPDSANIMGPRGPSGTSGAKGEDGTSIVLQSVTDVAGGKQVTLAWGETPSTSSFVIPSGAKGADGAAGFSPTIALTPVNSDASHNNGGTQVEITYKNGESTATTAYTAWNGNDGEGATVNLSGTNGVSVTKDGTNYTVGLSGGYYSDTLSAYSAMYAGYASNAKFSDNSVSSMDQIKGSIDWGNGIAGEYQTHSGDFVTSSIATISGTKQYALTTAGWVEVQTGTSFTGVNTDATLTGDGSTDNLGVAWSALSGNTIASANKASEAQGFRWGDNSYQDTSAALNNLWNSKNHVTLQTADNILTVDNNDNTSATLSAMSYISNTAHAGWLPQRSCVCQESEIYGMSELAQGQGMLFFVVSAY